MKYLSLFILAVLLTSGTDSEDKLIKRAKKIHAKALTVDSHVDTPMWLTRESFDFMKKQEEGRRRSKLDHPRMLEGGLDGVFFAVFVGQNERSPEGNAEALAEARQVIDSIQSLVDKNKDKLAVATTAEEFKAIEKQAKTAILLGMENGYPIGNDLALIDEFFEDGIRYITLCHSYNNDICDSSTDSVEHHGISEFGKQVIERMNDLGIMIDVSHASDESFYQAVELSRTPIIASHSCARALRDHPRNLTDDMLLKLKETGGVIQMCILSNYVKEQDPFPERDSARQAVWEKHGNYYDLDQAGKDAFLEDWYKVDEDYPAKLATVADAVDHIDHIVEVAGIDHVGIGTDFDGGGGLADCYDVSQLENITIELLRRGYSAKDIKKIWSGNLLRVMKEVEAAAV